MSPDPLDEHAHEPRPGWWRCFLCDPNVEDRGGEPDWRSHYLRLHWIDPEGGKP